MAKKRADILLVERGFAENRSRAGALILSGNVFSKTGRIEKAGELVNEEAEITVKEKPHPYVSRGGLKLAGALDKFSINVSGATAIDVGASTGGFTDCLLQRGAVSVLAIDVGKNQMDWKLRSDPRVDVREKFNGRDISPETAGGPFDIAVIDVSFISLELILGPVKSVIAPGGVVISLVKPQFEAGKAEADRGGGIIKDRAVQQEALEKIKSFGISIGLECFGHIESPIAGAKGNREFLLVFRN